MSRATTSWNLPEPAVVACLTNFADRSGIALAERFARRGAPPTLRILGSTDDPPAHVARALIEVQDIRLSGGARVRPDAGPTGLPLVVAVAAAAELTDLSPLERLARTARVDFRRSGQPGTVVALVYLGAALGQIPGDELLAALDPVPGFDLTLAFTDSDPCGRRLREDDAAEVAALLLDTVLTSGALRERLVSLARRRCGVVGFGICRVDLDETPLRHLVQRQLRRQARAILFPPPKAAPAKSGSGDPVPLDVAGLEAIHRLANGSYRPAVAALASSSARSAELWLEARLHESAAATRNALLALIPPPRPPRSPGCWARWRAWLKKMWRRVWGGRGSGSGTAGHGPGRPRGPAPAVKSSTVRRAELVATDRNRLQLLRPVSSGSSELP
jgi:hypothetical protein